MTTQHSPCRWCDLIPVIEDTSIIMLAFMPLMLGVIKHLPPTPSHLQPVLDRTHGVTKPKSPAPATSTLLPRGREE